MLILRNSIGFWRIGIIYFFLGGINLLILVTLPLINAKIVDSLAYGRDDSFQYNLLIAVVLTVSLGLIILITRIFVATTNERVVASLRNSFFQKILTLDAIAIESLSIGDSISKIINDIGAFKTFLIGIVFQSILDIISIIVIIIILLSMDPALTVLVLAPLPFALIISHLYQERVTKQSSFVRQALSNLASQIQTILSNLRAIANFSLQKISFTWFQKENTLTYTSSKSLIKSQSIIEAVNTLISSLPSIFILGYGGLQVLSGELSIGNLFAFITFSTFFIAPSQRLLQGYTSQLPELLPTIHRLNETFNQLSQKKSYYTTQIRSISFSKVKFKVGEYFVTVQDFKCNQNDIVAISGKNGSGKSSFCKYIKGTITPVEGKLVINDSEFLPNGHNDSVECFYNMQEPVIFNGTLQDNITIFDSNPDLDKYSEILIDLGLSHLDNPLTSESRYRIINRTDLSVGEIQKINFGRALYSKMQTLLLDEPEASLDVGTTAQLIKLLRKYSTNKIIFVASHSELLKEGCTKRIVCEKDGSNILIKCS